jgi:hypothetical protein
VQRALVIVGLVVGCGDSGTTLGAGDVVQSLEGAALAVDAEAIYLLRGSGEVWRAPLDGGEPVMLGASGQLQSKDVAVDATHAYWLTLNLQEIHRVPKLGGSPERIVTGAALRGWLGVRGPTLYFTVEGQTPGINAMPATGGAAPALVGPDARDTFVVTDQAVFYAGRLGEVFRADLPSGPVTTLAPANGEIISALAVADTDVFYTSVESDLETFSKTRLRRVPITGGTPKVLWEADKSALHTGMAIDATHIYWFHFKDVEGSRVRSELHRLRRDDDEHELYGGPWTSVRELAADETNVYVLAEGGTYRIAKMP